MQFTGLSGALWSFDHQRPDGYFPGKGSRWKGWAEDRTPVLIHELYCDLYPDEIEWVRAGIEIERLVASAGCSFLRRTLDTLDLETVFRAVSEWGEWSLLDYPLPDDRATRASVAAEVQQTVGEALRFLHELGFVHSDVAPNNILLVGGSWKLADLDVCVRSGEIARGVAREPYAAPGAHAGTAASAEWDAYGLAKVLEWVAGTTTGTKP